MNMNVAKLSALNRRTIVLGGLSVVLMVSLFFIPELVVLQDRLSGVGSQTVASANKHVDADNQLRDPVSDPETTIQSLRAALRDERSQPLIVESESEAPRFEDSPLEKVRHLLEAENLSLHHLNQQFPKGNSEDLEQEFQEGVLEAENRAGWPAINSGVYGETLERARTRALQIAARLHTDQIRSKYALVNFSNGIGFVRRSPSSVLSPSEARAFLEDLQLKATRALEQDGVSGELFGAWRSVSLDAQRGSDSLRLVKMDSSKRTTSASGGTRGVAMVMTDVTRKIGTRIVTVNGVIYSPKGEVVRLEVYRNGEYILDGAVYPAPNGFFKLFFRVPDGSGIFAIRAIEKSGHYYEKRYQLLPEDVRIESDISGMEDTVPF